MNTDYGGMKQPKDKKIQYRYNIKPNWYSSFNIIR